MYRARMVVKTLLGSALLLVGGQIATAESVRPTVHDELLLPSQEEQMHAIITAYYAVPQLNKLYQQLQASITSPSADVKAQLDKIKEKIDDIPKTSADAFTHYTDSDQLTYDYTVVTWDVSLISTYADLLPQPILDSPAGKSFNDYVTALDAKLTPSQGP